MKRRGRLFLTIFLIVAFLIGAISTVLIVTVKIAPDSAGKKTIKKFTFSSPESLKEWDEKVLAKKSTEYTVAEYDGTASVRASSLDSASALYHKQRLSFDRDPFLSWDWKAEKFPIYAGKEAIDKKSEFDFVAQVYVIFYARFFLNSKAIQYVWTETVPKGTFSDSPYTKKVKVLVLETGISDEWKHEERDIKKDFLHLFGEDLNKDVVAIAFMTDADSTDSEASAYYSNFHMGYLEKDKDSSEAAPKDVLSLLSSWFSKIPFVWEEDISARGKEEPVKKKVPGEVEVKKRIKIDQEIEDKNIEN